MKSGFHFIEGKQGAGKGLYMMRQILTAIRENGRPIITDFAVEKDAWVNGKHWPQLGLLGYLWREYKNLYDAEDLIFRINIEHAARFFLFRALPVEIEVCEGATLVKIEDGVMTAREFQRHSKYRLWKSDCMEITKKDQFGQDELRIVSFDYNLSNKSGGHDYFLDEVWRHWSARNWMRTGMGIQDYTRQHRKVSDCVWIATQRWKDIDSIMVGLCQDFHYLRNRGKLTVGLAWLKLKQPDDFRFVVTEQPFTNDKQVMLDYGTFKRDDEGIAQCYDTTSGAGLVGRLAGDLGVKTKGMSFVWVWVAMCIIPIVFAFTLYWFLHPRHGKSPANNLSTAAMHATAPITDNAQAAENGVAKWLGIDGKSSSSFGGRQQTVEIHIEGDVPDDTNIVKCVGYVILPNYIRCYFNNGDVAYDSEVNQIKHQWVTCWGKTYRVVSAVPLTGEYESQTTAINVLGHSQTVLQGDENNGSVYGGYEPTMPSIHANVDGINTPRLNGINAMPHYGGNNQ